MDDDDDTADGDRNERYLAGVKEEAAMLQVFSFDSKPRIATWLKYPYLML